MRIHPINSVKGRAFTLIEMIGVLAVIAILAALLIPKIFEAINNARVNNAAVSCGTVKTALADHYAKFGSILYDGSLTPPAAVTAPQIAFDGILLREAFLDKQFAAKIADAPDGTATGTRVEAIAGTTDATTTPTAANDGSVADSAYNLDGTGAADDATGSVVVHAVMANVTLNDARALNSLIDGTSATLGEAGPSGGAGVDLSGRVKYNIGTAAAGTVFVYLTHR